MYNVFSGAFECVRPSDRLCPSVRQILSVRPTDVRPSDRFAMGFAMGFATGYAMGFLNLPPPKDERKAPEGGHFASKYLNRLCLLFTNRTLHIAICLGNPILARRLNTSLFIIK